MRDRSDEVVKDLTIENGKINILTFEIKSYRDLLAPLLAVLPLFLLDVATESSNNPPKLPFLGSISICKHPDSMAKVSRSTLTI